MNEFSNYLLSRLRGDDLRMLQPHLERISLSAGEVLAHPGDEVDYVYFVESGVLSIISYLQNGDSIAVAATGREGVGGAFALLGHNVIPYRLLVQIPGVAYRVEAETLRTQLKACGQLLDLLHRYLQVLIAQIGQSAICNRYHSARQRLARWLLESADRADKDELPLTHDFIAQMVGGARSLVSTALMELREQGAIDYTRAAVRLNRHELTKHSCECYDTAKGLSRLFLE